MTSHAGTIRDKAETLAGLMSVGSLTPDESEVGVDVIFDLLAENQRLRDALEKLAVDSQYGTWQRVLAVDALAGDAE